MQLPDWFTKWFYLRQNGWFTLMVISAFACVISIFQVGSYHADKYKLNGLYIVLAVVFGLAAIYCLIKANQTSAGQPG